MQHIRALIVKLFFTQPITHTSQSLERFIDKGDSVLDLGMGSGVVASEFSKKFVVKIEGADIGDFRSTTIPLTVFDGKTLPFPDNYFDHVLLSFTLHHASNPKQLLLEAKRVAKKYIFIYEETPNNDLFRVIAWHIHSFFYSLIFKNRDGGYLSEKSWLQLFSSLHLKVVLNQSINWFHPLNLVSKTLFVLKIP